jgi:nucleotide-binding universal stress UspA family protein
VDPRCLRRETKVMGIKSIVVGIDGSETSYRAFAMAVGVAVRENGCVHACFVAHLPGAAAIGGFFAPVPLLADSESDERLARYVTEELFVASIGGDFTYRTGEIAAEIEILAETCRADLIVVGRSEHPHLHLGGVPRQLLGRGRFPILVVP